jgi:transposase, IS5 family
MVYFRKRLTPEILGEINELIIKKASESERTSEKPVEFGAKLDISVSNGFVRLERQFFDAYNEAEYLQEVIERYKVRTGSYPECVLADKIYRNRNNLGYCKEHGIRLSGPALGRP